MSDPFRLVLISAWNDSGGGFLHRLFDGHPECFVYPFELTSFLILVAVLGATVLAQREKS